MAEKSFLEKFNKYQPTDTEALRVLSNVVDYSVRVVKDARLIEAQVHFSELVDKSLLYRIENEIKDAYQINVMKILPKYHASLFDRQYFTQILIEAEKVGVVARGFFSNCDYKIEGNKITVIIPFGMGGIDLLNDAKTQNVIRNIILSEFGIEMSVSIVNDESLSASTGERMQDETKKFDREIAEQSKKYDAAVNGANESDNTLQREMSLSKDGASVQRENDIITIGYRKFNIGSPEYFYGEEFDIDPKPIATLKSTDRPICIVGEVFDFAQEPARRGNNFSTTFSVYDGNTSIEVRAYKGEKESRLFADAMPNGTSIAPWGTAKQLQKKDKTLDKDLTFEFKHAAKIKRIKRTDDADEKRVELHLHTQMSAMDALLPPEEAVKRAHEWGHRAVAITDHGNVQAYQMAMGVAQKLKMKVLYGMEAYYVNDKTSAVSGEYKGTFSDEFIVFDIETTGLSPLTSQIIEIGAVKIKNGEILEEFDEFVDPGIAIPENITELTGISDADVQGADKIPEVLKRFLDFV